MLTETGAALPPQEIPDRAARLAREALHLFAATPRSRDMPWDPGPMVLADHARLEAGQLETTSAAWLERIPAPPGPFSVFAGHAGLVMGLWHLSRAGLPDQAVMKRTHARLRDELLLASRRAGWARPVRDWYDYDLVTGPAGLLLSMLPDGAVEAEQLAPVVAHLVGLLEAEDLAALRPDGCGADTQRRWNLARVNLGLAHGVPGVIAALSGYVRRYAPEDERVYMALERATGWLIAQAHRDRRGLTTWAPGSEAGLPDPAPASHREAWCYGAPANAWVIWEAGDVLDRPAFRSFALETFHAYASRFDPAFHLDRDPLERLAICHGAAGIMLIADAFVRHAGFAPAEALRGAMRELVEARLGDVPAMMVANPTMLSGASGVLSAIFTIQGGRRDWLSALGMR